METNSVSLNNTESSHASLEISPKASAFKRGWNKVVNYISKPQNILLIVLAIVLTVLVIVPLISSLLDTFKLHPGYAGEDPNGELTEEVWSLNNWASLFPKMKRQRAVMIRTFWRPFGNSLALAVLSCLFAILFGGIVAYLVTRTNLKCKKYISSIFIFPYIMPQWTLAMVWKNLFDNTAAVGHNGFLATEWGWIFPNWWVQGLFPSAMVLGLHYAPFAYILIGGVFRNMDANLEEAATILNTPKWKIFFRVTLPMVMPAIVSTILLVFSSALGSYPVPHYLKYDTLATKYMELNVDNPGLASIISVIMMVIGVAILLVNMKMTSGRKQYTTVTGKSGQASKVNLGKAGSWIIAVVLIIFTFMTSIFPLISFTIETFCQNPGDYSAFTTKWWANNSIGEENGMYGQLGILHNWQLWRSFGGSVFVAFFAAILAGTIGTLVGYCCAKNRKSKFAEYVNAIAFIPYLLPSLSVGAAYFVISNQMGLWNKYITLIIVGMVKYIPFASRASFNSMIQLSGEIEESAIIQDVPWWKRMLRIIVPIQKSSILSGYLLPFITGMRELTLFMMLADDSKLATLQLGYFDEMGLYAFSSAINLVLVVIILLVNFLANKLTGASLDKGIGG